MGDIIDLVECLTAYDLTMDSFPDIMGTSRHSTGTGLHKIDFKGIEWKNHPKPMTVRLTAEDDIHYREHFLCGAEISTSGRYVTHVLNPIGGVAKKLGYLLTFSDWTAAGKMLSWPSNALDPTEKEPKKEPKDKHSIPDYALICTSPKGTRALGEAKHPWGTRPDLYVKRTRQGVKMYEGQLRRFVGQISRDMWAAELKFAFMTTYRWTVFLRRELVNGTWTLFYSDAIPYDAKSVLGDKSTQSVSVRECMLYLIHVASEAESIWSLKGQEREPLTDWAEILPPAPRPEASSTASTPSQLRAPVPSETKIQLPERPRPTNIWEPSTTNNNEDFTDVGQLISSKVLGKDYYVYKLNGKTTAKPACEWKDESGGLVFHPQAKVKGVRPEAAAK